MKLHLWDMVGGYTVYANRWVGSYPIMPFEATWSAAKGDRFVNYPWPRMMDCTWDYRECLKRGYYAVLLGSELNQN